MTKRKKFGISKNLTDSMSHTVKVASHNVGALRHEIVPIKLIELDPNNPRQLIIEKSDIINGIENDDKLYDQKKKEIENLDSLRNSIIKQGVLNPVWVYKYNTHYRLIMGERRVLASLLAGNDEIQAKILEQRPKDVDLRLLQWIENLERSDLTLWERIVNIKLIIDAKQKVEPAVTINATYIKNLLSCSLPHAMNYFAVIYCSAELMHAIEEGRINNLEKAALLANINDKELLEEVYELCLSGTSLKRLQQIVRSKKLNPPALSVIRKKKENSMNCKPKVIELGSCKKPEVLRKVIESVLQQPDYSVYNSHFDKVNWFDNIEVSRAFKSFIVKLESNS